MGLEVSQRRRIESKIRELDNENKKFEKLLFIEISSKTDENFDKIYLQHNLISAKTLQMILDTRTNYNLKVKDNVPFKKLQERKVYTKNDFKFLDKIFYVIINKELVVRLFTDFAYLLNVKAIHKVNSDKIEELKENLKIGGV